MDNPAIDPEELLAHAGWLHRLAARLVESSAVEDLLQDTYVVALKSPGDVVLSPRPWLAQVLRNLARNRARGAARWSARKRRLSAESAAPLPSADELLTQHEARRLVAELVSTLEEPFRSTVLLCYGQGLAPTEVARKQEIPPGTVRWRLKRGLDDLRAALDQRYGNDRRAWCVALAPLAAAAVPVGGALPIAGAIKLAAGVAAAAALGVWLGTWPASQPAATAGALESTAPATWAGAPRPRPRRFAAATPAPQGPEAGPQTAVAASSAEDVPRRAAVGGSAPAGKPPSEAIQKVMQAGNAPAKGDPTAPVTVVMFTDFQCPFSARAQELMAQLLAAYPGEIRLVARNLLMPFHEHAKAAAEAALAAHEQGKYWAMHDRLFANQTALDPPALAEHARAIGLDVSRFRRALEDQRFLATVEEDARLAREAGIEGIPTFVINGKILAGAQPLSHFKEAVEQALGRPKPPAPVLCDPAAPDQATAATKGEIPADPVALARAAAPGNAPSKGEPGAPVTIVLFNDFQCEFCRRNAPVMDQLLAAYPKQLRLVFKNLPLSNHKQAPLAAEAALAAHEQGKFWAMHDRLFANQHTLGPEALEQHATQVGLDLDRFRAAMKERRFRQAVERDAQDAKAAGIHGTPTGLINGRKLFGAWGIDAWKGSIERELDRTRGLRVGDEPLPERRPLDGPPLEWPPPRVTIPDELLGERLAIAVPTGDAPSIGAPRAPVEVLYVFSNNDGPLGGWGKRMVDHLREAHGNNLRIIARPVPSSASSTNAQLVAEAAWAAHAQGKFWQMHDKLFSGNVERNRATLERYAAEIGLQLADFRTALDQGRYRNKVAEDTELLRQAGLTTRPLFVVNGRHAEGRIALVQLVETALRKAGLKVPSVPETPNSVARPPVDASTPQWFHLEKRDDSWAAAVERGLARIVEPDLRSVDPAVKAVEVECKSLLCRLRFRSGKQPHAANFAKQVYGAELWRPGASADDHAYLHLREGPPLRPVRATAEETVTKLRSRRAGLLFSLRTGRVQPRADLPLARLPSN